MKIYLIKYKGATIWQNMFFDRELLFSDGNKINTGILFFRKKDAEAYLKTLKYTEFYEVVGADVPKSNQDNRRKNDNSPLQEMPSIFSKGGEKTTPHK